MKNELFVSKLNPAPGHLVKKPMPHQVTDNLKQVETKHKPQKQWKY